MMVRVTWPRVVAGLATMATVAAGAVVLRPGERPAAHPPPAAAIPSAPVVPSASPSPGASPSTTVPGVVPEPSPVPSSSGPSSSSGRSPRPAPPPVRHTSSPPAATPTPTPSPSAPGSLLKRADPVPEGVAEQVRFFLGGDGICMEDSDRVDPHITGVWDGMERPFESDVCFHDFDLGQTLFVTLAGPDGLGKEMEVEFERVSAYETFHLRLEPPGLVPGRWRLEVRQSGAYTSTEYTVRRATEPRAWVENQMNDRTREAGEDVRYFLGGFPANRTVRLDLYRIEGRGYLTSIPVAVDGNGEARGVLRTEPDDPPGCYGISHPLLYPKGPADVSFEVFCLERPG